MSHHGQPSRRNTPTTKTKQSGLSFNIAVAMHGDMQAGDHLREFLRDPEPVETDDYTQTELVNAVKKILQDPNERPAFHMNQNSSLKGKSFLRVDASIWIGVPGAPMNWDAPEIPQGWQEGARLGLLRLVKHAAVDTINPLTPPSKRDFEEEVREGGQQQQQLKKKRQRRVMGSNRGNEASHQTKRQKISALDQDRARELPAESQQQVNKSTEEDFLTTPLKSEGPGYDCNVVPSSVLDDDILGVTEESLFPGLDIGSY